MMRLRISFQTPSVQSNKVLVALPAMARVVGEPVRVGGPRSTKVSGAGGGRVFRDLDLLAAYMFSSSAYTADSLCGGNVKDILRQ